MLQLVVLLAVSWGLARTLGRTDLTVLGLRPTGERLLQAMLLFLVAAACCAMGYAARMFFAQERFNVGPERGMLPLLIGLWANFSSVLFEELLCRGVGLHLLIRWTGRARGIVLSALVFALLHVVHPGALANPVQAMMSFAFTFAMGLVLAYSYERTRSLYHPFAIHFGWNLVQNFVFPDGPYPATLLVRVLPVPEVTVSYAAAFSIFVLPQLTVMVLGSLLVRRMAVASDRA